VDFFERLEKELSPRDSERMQTWIAGLATEEQRQLLQFIFDRETRAPAVGDEAPDLPSKRLRPSSQGIPP
jgi:hypothetical protein